MTKVIAIGALAALLVVCTLGNYWLTFGLWPKSWGWFTFFALVSILLSALLQLVTKEKS